MAHANGDAIPYRTTGDEGIAIPVLLVENPTEAVMAQAPTRETTTAWRDTAINQHLMAAGDGDIQHNGGDEMHVGPTGAGAPPTVPPCMATAAPPPVAEGECYTPHIWNAKNINQMELLPAGDYACRSMAPRDIWGHDQSE